jgi:hypothetical protein
MDEYEMTLIQKQEKEKRQATQKAKIEVLKQEIKKNFGDYFGSLIIDSKVVI